MLKKCRSSLRITYAICGYTSCPARRRRKMAPGDHVNIHDCRGNFTRTGRVIKVLSDSLHVAPDDGGEIVWDYKERFIISKEEPCTLSF